MNRDYFLVKFASKVDYDFAKFEGLWMVLDHYLIIKEWSPNFDPSLDVTEKVLVWVRFSCLPIKYYDRTFLMNVGEKIGRPVRVDQATNLVSRGKFARICVEVDIAKPLLAKFKLEAGFVESRGVVREAPNGNVANLETTDNFSPYMLFQCKTRRIERNKTPKDDRLMLHGNKGTMVRRTKRGGSNSFAALVEQDMGVDIREYEGKNQDEFVEVSRLQGRARRPNVQVNIMERIDFCVEGPFVTSTDGKGKEVMRGEVHSRERVAGPSLPCQAAIEEEHVLMRGSRSGAAIVITMQNKISKTSNRLNSFFLFERDGGSHHQDPPLVDQEGRRLMVDKVGIGSDILMLERDSPLVSGDQTDVICRKIGFDYWIRVKAVAFSGGIWIFWNDRLQGLLDLGFKGLHFTWMRGIVDSTFKEDRLDRVLCNVDWRDHFPQATVSHLPQAKSDHCSLLIQKKRRLWARIEGIQCKFVVQHNQGLLKLEVKLRKQLDEILFEEEILWFQKSQKDWIRSGDRNAKF
ncbi:hypothetical protein PTKIN_Ptkin09bG0069600 [Pterospermum kingtungense]